MLFFQLFFLFANELLPVHGQPPADDETSRALAQLDVSAGCQGLADQSRLDEFHPMVQLLPFNFQKLVMGVGEPQPQTNIPWREVDGRLQILHPPLSVVGIVRAEHLCRLSVFFDGVGPPGVADEDQAE